MSELAATSLSALLAMRAAKDPERVALGFLERTSERLYTYRELAAAARAVGEALRERAEPGDRVVLALGSTRETVLAFFGCQFAGLIPIPVAAPGSGGSWIGRRVRKIASSSEAALVLVSNPAATVEFGDLPTVAFSTVPDAGSGTEPLESPQDIAFLQYTSGSTQEPRGVIVTQDSVLANVAIIEEAFEHDRSSITVNWLPMHHDMGLIGTMLHPIFAGFPSYLLSPRSFLANPVSWLKAITRLRATTAGGPCFGYELCLNRIGPEALADLDLSSLRVTFCGAEPIRVEVLERFAERFASVGFAASSLYACYGLAESTLFVTGTKVGSGIVQRPRAGDEALPHDAAPMRLPERLAGCGHPRADSDVRIVDAESGREVTEGEVGEIWVRGRSVARGYFNRPKESRDVFGRHLESGEGPFMRTGDLGVFSERMLYVVGRLKDVLIVDAVKCMAHDVEASCRSAGGGCVTGALAAELFEEARAQAGIELWLSVDPSVLAARSLVELGESIRRRVSGDHGVPVVRVAIVPTKAIRRTSSGKIERGATLRELRGDPSLVLASYTTARGWQTVFDAWRFCPTPRPAARMRLFILGSAGAGASSYMPLVRHMPDFIEVVAINYPGRDGRRDEPGITRMPQMVAALETCFAQWAPQAYALLGHSMGGRIAVALARRLSAKGQPPRALLLASCSEPNTIPEPMRSSYKLDPAQFEAYVRAFGVIPQSLAARSGGLPESLISTLRTDFELNDTVEMQAFPRLELPGLLLRGAADPIVRPHNMEGWLDYFKVEPALQDISGGHFFLQDQPREAATAIARFLSDECLSAAPSRSMTAGLEAIQ